MSKAWKIIIVISFALNVFLLVVLYGAYKYNNNLKIIVNKLLYEMSYEPVSDLELNDLLTE
jgi:hypothetical protein